ncbi:MAG: hypothetical protein ABW039_04675 [Sphingobium sp.]
MFDTPASWRRLVASGLVMMRTGLRAIEAAGAAGEVVAARSMILGSALRAPLSADHEELAQMLPEKMDALSRAGAATFATLLSAHASWTEQVRQIGALALRADPPTPGRMIDLGGRMASLAIGSFEAQARMGAVALEPVHRRVVSNANRLRKR